MKAKRCNGSSDNGARLAVCSINRMVEKEIYMRPFWSLALVGVVALGVAPAYAQQGPPIHGVTGTMATEATVKAEHKAANKIVVETEDGVEHVYDAAKGLVVHGGKDPLSDLKPGTTVVIHYTGSEEHTSELQSRQYLVCRL